MPRARTRLSFCAAQSLRCGRDGLLCLAGREVRASHWLCLISPGERGHGLPAREDRRASRGRRRRRRRGRRDGWREDAHGLPCSRASPSRRLHHRSNFQFVTLAAHVQGEVALVNVIVAHHAYATKCQSGITHGALVVGILPHGQGLRLSPRGPQHNAGVPQRRTTEERRSLQADI